MPQYISSDCLGVHKQCCRSILFSMPMLQVVDSTSKRPPRSETLHVFTSGADGMRGLTAPSPLRHGSGISGSMRMTRQAMWSAVIVHTLGRSFERWVISSYFQFFWLFLPEQFVCLAGLQQSRCASFQSDAWHWKRRSLDPGSGPETFFMMYHTFQAQQATVGAGEGEGEGKSGRPPGSRRISTSNACIECRRRKIRCDGKSPCGQCLWYQQPELCTYSKPTQRVVPSRKYGPVLCSC